MPDKSPFILTSGAAETASEGILNTNGANKHGKKAD